MNLRIIQSLIARLDCLSCRLADLSFNFFKCLNAFPIQTRPKTLIGKLRKTTSGNEILITEYKRNDWKIDEIAADRER